MKLYYYIKGIFLYRGVSPSILVYPFEKLLKYVYWGFKTQLLTKRIEMKSTWESLKEVKHVWRFLPQTLVSRSLMNCSSESLV
jgi:hypothetical protein